MSYITHYFLKFMYIHVIFVMLICLGKCGQAGWVALDKILKYDPNEPLVGS
jgi:hypothetical protein